MADEGSIYKPLDTSRKEIRVIRMRHNNDCLAEIECELQTISLDSETEHPAFKALSYCWTEFGATEKVSLNGTSFFVRPNLYEYLKIMHEERHENWIFIDALCIDQENEAEQSSQVLLMGQVYRNAVEVVAWQGVSWTVWDWYGFDPSETNNFLDQDLAISLRALEHAEHGIHRDDAQCKASISRFAAAFINSEYWSRVWIVQEVILARRLTFQFRHFRASDGLLLQFMWSYLPFRDFEFDYIRWDGESPGFMDVTRIKKTAHLLSLILTQRRLLWSSKKQDDHVKLTVAVYMTARQNCHRRHDKIFGLLGLTNSCLQADYQMAEFELFLRVLVEGLRVNELVSDSAEVSEFMRSLLAAFNFSIEHPVVALAVHESFDFLHAHPYHHIFVLDRLISFKQMKPSYHQYWLPLISWLWDIDDHLCHMRCKTLKFRLRMCKASNWPVSSPDSKLNRRPYNEWVAWMHTIMNDVSTQMESKGT